MSPSQNSKSSVTSPGPDISRHRLKQLASWIRDDLDVAVAREGPDVLRPDDVVTLHEAFVALRHSTSITALDLRSTGIHKAVKDVAGIATRWPARLCDDCDKIIALWTSNFGPLDELHPFLFGRGGRLEGIATLAECSREALIKRWSQTCPDKIDPKVSHRQGDLGFRAGDWWINPLFAHYAGILGLESVDGGSTYDKDGAYALLLKDVSKVDARDEDVFTYHFPPNDKGRFRLTAATARSRKPIRVLRSHSVSNIWGPKVGVRYEGLYSVKSWRIRQAKLGDTPVGKWKEGEILYEVTLQRNDPVPIMEVIRRPTIVEVDDYAEYMRLRKLHREDKRQGHGLLPSLSELGSILPSLQIPVSPKVAPQSLLRISPSLSRTATFKELAFDAPGAIQGSEVLPSSETLSPMTISDQQDFFLVPKKVADFTVPDKGGSDSIATSSNSTSIVGTLPDRNSRDLRTSVPRSIKVELKEILPWMNLEDEQSAVTSSDALVSFDQHSAGKALDKPEARAAEMNPVKNVRGLARDTRWPPSLLDAQIQETAEEDAATNAPYPKLSPTKPIRMAFQETGRKRPAPRMFGRKPRFFDGAGHGAKEADDVTYSQASRARHFRSSSADDAAGLHPPVPIISPKAHSLHDYGIEEIEFASPLDDLVPHPMISTPMNSFTSSPPASPSLSQACGESIALGKLKRWLSK